MENETNTQSKTKLGVIKIFLFILIAELFFICFNQYQKLYSTNNSPRTLIVSIEDIDDSDINFSPSEQIENALENGGLIYINLDSDWLNDNFYQYYGLFGATDSEGMYFVLGGIINYISSKGWTLVQAPTSGLNNFFYFTKSFNN